MTFSADDQAMSFTATTEGNEPDLTDGLGRQILDGAVESLKSHFFRAIDPDGRPWERLSPSTIAQRVRKGFSPSAIGLNTGDMADGLSRGDFQVSPTSAIWTYPVTEKARNFHNGNPDKRQPARRFVGWTAAAIQRAESLLTPLRARGRTDDLPNVHGIRPSDAQAIRSGSDLYRDDDDRDPDEPRRL